ncbi:hypothetical protein BpHYR1_048857 [Brachionus plicatilis]|uniref:Uncharacterized protein n=1 Tax=Brachionus plicatilis TaxID=10195 RepID=A0A3M7SM13_BRAPC|nr:hypothetical protein BpHYR1_048857 [Brachionus plicatilis]
MTSPKKRQNVKNIVLKLNIFLTYIILSRGGDFVPSDFLAEKKCIVINIEIEKKFFFSVQNKHNPTI